MKRPKHLDPPAYLSPSPRVPAPEDTGVPPPPAAEGDRDPTRYGDWEKNGIAVDF